MSKNKVEKKNNINIIFVGTLLLSSLAAYIANEAYNKSKSAESTSNSSQSNLDLKLEEGIIRADNTNNSISITSLSPNSEGLSLISNGGTDSSIVVRNIQGVSLNSIDIRSDSGGISLTSSEGVRFNNGGIIIPTKTTAEAPSVAGTAGKMIFNTNDKKIYIYDGSSWISTSVLT